jgi:hypothetical protein
MELLTKPFAMTALAEKVGAMLASTSVSTVADTSANTGAADEVPA